MALLAVTSGLSLAQHYPNRPVRILVPFGAGAPDTVARLLAPQLAAQLEQSFLVENRPGANGVIGTDVVAKAPADGYTLLVTSASIAVNPSVYKKLPYDLERDIVPVSNLCATEALILGVNPAVPARKLRELLELARKPETKLAYGSPGVGNTLHLAGALFAPAGTSPEIIARLHAAVRRALTDATVRERLAGLGLYPIGSAPAEFKSLFDSQIKAFAEMVKLAGIVPE